MIRTRMLINEGLNLHDQSSIGVCFSFHHMLTHPTPAVDVASTSNYRFSSKAFVYVLVAIFGLGTWTNLAGVWIELPIIVPILPESWQLPAKLSLLINLANIFPILIVFASFIFRLNTAPFEVPVNFILLTTSITFAIGYAFLWDKTAYLFGMEQSIFLMLLCFFGAISDCLSSTTFIPFLHRYEPIYLNAYFTGEAFTALLPALIGMAQGIGPSECSGNGTSTMIHHQPRFSVRTYFLILSLLPFAALLSFIALRMIKTGRLQTSASTNTLRSSSSRVFILMENIGEMKFIEDTIETINRIERRLKDDQRKNSFTDLFRFQPAIFLFIVLQCSVMLYGICQGLTTFSLNAYSVTTFHYTIIGSKIREEKKKKLFSFLFKVNLHIRLWLFLVYSSVKSHQKRFISSMGLVRDYSCIFSSLFVILIYPKISSIRL